MSIYGRIKRRLDYDTTTEIEHEEPRYEYTVTHLNGETTVQEGNKHRRDEGFLLIEEKNDGWAIATFEAHNSYTGPPWRGGYDIIRELEGVQEVEREQIGIDRWIFTVDKADRAWLDTKKEYDPL